MISRPVPSDTTPDRLASAEKAEPKTPRTDPASPSPVEPHWELLIAAATD
ncbi:MAG TPA: hypothetical protein VIK30_16425 [Polyangia bacterium]